MSSSVLRQCKSSRRRSVSEAKSSETLAVSFSTCMGCIAQTSGLSFMPRNYPFDKPASGNSKGAGGFPANQVRRRTSKGPPEERKKCITSPDTRRRRFRRRCSLSPLKVKQECVKCNCLPECSPVVEECFEGSSAKYLGCYKDKQPTPVLSAVGKRWSWRCAQDGQKFHWGWCYERCHDTATRKANQIPRKNKYFCNYGNELPIRAVYYDYKHGQDYFQRDLATKAGHTTSTSTCMRWCDSKVTDGSKYFSLQNGVCYCGNSYGEPEQLYPKDRGNKCSTHKLVAHKRYCAGNNHKLMVKSEGECEDTCRAKGLRYFSLWRRKRKNKFKCLCQKKSYCRKKTSKHYNVFRIQHRPKGKHGYNAVYERSESARLAEVRKMCKKEDDKEANCAEKALMDYYENDVCFGSKCSIKKSSISSIIVSIVLMIVDEIIGCAFGFWMQMRFWTSVTGGNTAKDAHNAEGSEKLTVAEKGGASAANFVAKNIAGTKGYWTKSAEVAAKKAAAKQANKEMVRQAAKAAAKAAAQQGVSEVAEGLGKAAGQSAAKAGLKSGLKSGLTAGAKKFKNFLPCVLLACLGWLDGGATFFTCMGECLAAALGMHVAKLVYRLIKSCLWKILKDAMGGCFPSDATVQLSTGSTVPMLKLRIGDRVLTADGSYSEVYVISHQEPTRITEFVQLKLQHHTIEATAGHFLPISRACDHVTEDARASDVTEGMCLFVSTAGQTKKMQPVLSKHRVIKQGVYNPFTMQGTLVVNGVTASSHSDWFLDDFADSLGLTHMLPTIYQAVLGPARGLYNVVTWVAGPEAVRKVLFEYKSDMADAADKNLVFKPYFDLLVRGVKLVTSN